MKIPEEIRSGLTWQRLRKVLGKPFLLLRNARFWWNEDVSTERHIFVVGPPRCGTTLIKNVLQSHSDVCGVEYETFFFLRENYVDFRHPGVADEKMKALIRKSRSVVELYDRLAAAVKGEKGGKRFLEKTPGHALRLSYIVNHFPKADIVFVVRDPRDGLYSAKNTPHVWSNYPDEDRHEGYLSVWHRSVQEYYRHQEETSLSLVKYESFCRSPKEALEGLAGRLNLDYQRQQLDPDVYGNTADSDPYSHTLLRKPITTERIGRWRKNLTAEEVSRIETVLEDKMRKLNYSLTSIQ